MVDNPKIWTESDLRQLREETDQQKVVDYLCDSYEVLLRQRNSRSEC